VFPQVHGRADQNGENNYITSSHIYFLNNKSAVKELKIGRLDVLADD